MYKIRHSLVRLACGLALLTLPACGGAAVESHPLSNVAVATIRAGDEIPVPDKPAVTIDGAISRSNIGTEVALDVATLEQMGLVEYQAHDPWLDTDLKFTGVLLSDLLDVVGASPNATLVHFVAIDDYEVDIKISDARRWPILLATQTNDKPMAIADKGPLRIVFPYDQYPEIDQLKYKDLWIWQIASIEIR
jgi:hypothetical protein